MYDHKQLGCNYTQIGLDDAVPIPPVEIVDFSSVATMLQGVEADARDWDICFDQNAFALTDMLAPEACPGFHTLRVRWKGMAATDPDDVITIRSDGIIYGSWENPADREGLADLNRTGATMTPFWQHTPCPFAPDP